jgi:hypothetical protein
LIDEVPWAIHKGKSLGYEKEVRRMLDPGHVSKIPRIARALQALGKRLQISVV